MSTFNDRFGVEPNFTRELSQDLTQLGTEIGIKMALISHQKSEGGFQSDIVAEELICDRVTPYTRGKRQARIILVEAQYGETDHDHLNKLRTYERSATIRVWLAGIIANKFRDIIDKLNDENSGVLYYLVKMQLVEGQHMPIYTTICKPGNRAHEASMRGARAAVPKTPHQKSEAYTVKWRYGPFSAHLETTWKKRLGWTIPPLTQIRRQYAHVSAGVPNGYLETLFNEERLVVGARIHNNMNAYEYFYAYKAEIERELGEPLIFDPKGS